MIKLTAQGKFIDSKEMERLFTQGEKNSDLIHIQLDAVNNDVNVSELSFVMRTAASDGSMTESILHKTVTGELVELTWKVPDTATAVAGMLLLELIGFDETEVIIKYKMPPVFVKEAVMGSNIPVPDVVEEKLAQMNLLVEEIAELAEQVTGETGVVNEVTAARKSAFSDTVFNSLSQRLLADFSTRVGQSDLEEAIGNAIIQANDTGVGRFWLDENGVRQGEIFDDYDNNIAYCKFAHAEGYNTKAGKADAQTPGVHAEGYSTEATNPGAHSEGYCTKSQNVGTHSEGAYTSAGGNYSHAEGYYTIAASTAQHVGGKYNIIDNQNKYARIIGNGTSDEERSNALTLDWSGNLWISGDMAVTNVSGETVSICGTAALTESALGMSRKNILKNSTGTTTMSGITFTHNSDGSVTCSGTATADTNYRYIAQLKPNTKYILSGCPSGGSTSAYNLFGMDADTWTKIYRDIGSGVTFDTGSCSTWHFIIRIASGQTVDGLTFFPMLRNAAVTNSDYEQYTEDLQTQINQIKSQLAALTAAAE